jgi:hypothetical protein
MTAYEIIGLILLIVAVVLSVISSGATYIRTEREELEPQENEPDALAEHGGDDPSQDPASDTEPEGF